MFDVGIADGTDADGLLGQGLLVFRRLGLVVRQLHDHFGRPCVFVDALEEGTFIVDILHRTRGGRCGVCQRFEDLGLLHGQFTVHELFAAGHALDAVFGSGRQTVVLVRELLFLAGVLDDVDEAFAERAQLVHEAALAELFFRLVIDGVIVVDKARHVVGLVGQIRLRGLRLFGVVHHVRSVRRRGRLEDRSLRLCRCFGCFFDRFFRFGCGFLFRFLGGFFRRGAEQVVHALYVRTFIFVEVVVVVIVVVVEVIFLVHDGKGLLFDCFGFGYFRGLAHQFRDQVRDHVLLSGFQEVVDLVH